MIHLKGVEFLLYSFFRHFVKNVCTERVLDLDTSNKPLINLSEQNYEYILYNSHRVETHNYVRLDSVNPFIYVLWVNYNNGVSNKMSNIKNKLSIFDIKHLISTLSVDVDKANKTYQKKIQKKRIKIDIDEVNNIFQSQINKPGDVCKDDVCKDDVCKDDVCKDDVCKKCIKKNTRSESKPRKTYTYINKSHRFEAKIKNILLKWADRNIKNIHLTEKDIEKLCKKTLLTKLQLSRWVSSFKFKNKERINKSVLCN